ncbi:MAG: M48 family metallopeptidase [Prevotella sp.]|jgi:heat shock protein HtpX
MEYVGMLTQIRRNNTKSVMLLVMFPVIILVMVWVFIAIIFWLEGTGYDRYGNTTIHQLDVVAVNAEFMNVMPWVVGGVAVWFAIAYFSNVQIINNAVSGHPITRKENPRIYNIVENLCITCNMPMPKVCIVDDPQLNAFASGINNKTYTVTLTQGIIDLLNDDELAGVIGHELTHIRNRDTRLLITSIVFVGIVSTVMSLVLRLMYNHFWFGSSSSRENSNSSGGSLSTIVVLLVGLVCCFIAYIFTLLTRFAISRKREYMADAGGAELCGNPLALASALRKISANPGLDNVKRPDVAQLFICQPDEMEHGLLGFMDSLFSTHPSTEKRIAILEQF